MKTWYYEDQGHEIGPVTSSDLKRLADSGCIGPKCRVRLSDRTNWRYAQEINGLFLDIPNVVSPAEPQPAAIVVTERRPVLIEKTAKRWKRLQLIGVLTIVTGCVIMVAALSTFDGSARHEDRAIAIAVYGGLPILFVGIIVYFIGRFYAWWQHG